MPGSRSEATLRAVKQADAERDAEAHRREEAAAAAQRAERTRNFTQAGLTPTTWHEKKRAFFRVCVRYFAAQPVIFVDQYAVSADAAVAQTCRLEAEAYGEALVDPTVRRVTCTACDLYGEERAGTTCLIAREIGCPKGPGAEQREKIGRDLYDY
jgi:hypothetical protein